MSAEGYAWEAVDFGEQDRDVKRVELKPGGTLQLVNEGLLEANFVIGRLDMRSGNEDLATYQVQPGETIELPHEKPGLFLVHARDQQNQQALSKRRFELLAGDVQTFVVRSGRSNPRRMVWLTGGRAAGFVGRRFELCGTQTGVITSNAEGVGFAVENAAGFAGSSMQFMVSDCKTVFTATQRVGTGPQSDFFCDVSSLVQVRVHNALENPSELERMMLISMAKPGQSMRDVGSCLMDSMATLDMASGSASANVSLGGEVYLVAMLSGQAFAETVTVAADGIDIFFPTKVHTRVELRSALGTQSPDWLERVRIKTKQGQLKDFEVVRTRAQNAEGDRCTLQFMGSLNSIFIPALSGVTQGGWIDGEPQSGKLQRSYVALADMRFAAEL